LAERINLNAQFVKQNVCIWVGVIIMAIVLILPGVYSPGSPWVQAQEVLPQDENACLLCHENIFDNLAEYRHKPFLEKNCCQCHGFQFENIFHKISFQSLAPENIYYFRLKRFSSESQSIHVSQEYSFDPPIQGGTVINFPDSNGLSQLELVTDRWDPSSATLTWQTASPEYCLIEWDIHDSFAQAACAHSENPNYLKGIGITACYQSQCHPKDSLGVSHPVNILPSDSIKEKMVKAHLPTGQNGLLICLTCHVPHTGPEKNLGQKAVSEDLCVVCHPKGIYNPE